MNGSIATRHREAAKPISVMVVDDSAGARSAISRAIMEQQDMTVLAWASDGRMALVEARRQPFDLIVLDLDMPILSGLAILPRLLLASPTARVLIVSQMTRRTAGMIFEALELGAADFLCKPDDRCSGDAFAQTLIAKARALGRGAQARDSMSTHCVTHPSLAGVAHANAAETRAKPKIIAIAGSAGAPRAMLRLFERLIGRVDQPIFVAAPLPPDLVGLFAAALARSGGRLCAEALDGERVVRGRAYVAPGGRQLTVAREGSGAVIRLRREGPASLYPGTIDAMLVSLAELCGAQLFAALLSGDGRDGVKGCRAVAEVGGRFVVQDEASSLAWELPGAAARTGLADRLVPLADMAACIAHAAGYRG